MLEEEVRDKDFWIVSDDYNNFDKLQCVLGEMKGRALLLKITFLFFIFSILRKVRCVFELFV